MIAALCRKRTSESSTDVKEMENRKPWRHNLAGTRSMLKINGFAMRGVRQPSGANKNPARQDELKLIAL